MNLHKEMKTEVKFREMPEKVQKFISRIFGLYDPFTVQLNWLHNIDEWSQATDEERLAYAEWRYPVGSKYKNAHPDDTEVFILKENCYKVNYLGEENSIGTNGQGWILWKNKWAELVSEPEEKQSLKEASPSAQQYFVKANPGMKHVEEFKTGEIVNEYVGGEIYQPVIYRFFAENKHWVSDTKFDTKVWCPQEIRKIDTDRYLKELAKPIMEYWGFIEDGKCDPCILAALVDMGKKVKNEPGFEMA